MRLGHLKFFVYRRKRFALANHFDQRHDLGHDQAGEFGTRCIGYVSAESTSTRLMTHSSLRAPTPRSL